MASLTFLILTHVCIVGCEALTPADCGAYARKPDYTDISVVCGTSYIDLAIQICPAVYSGYSETFLTLNSIVDDGPCKGRLDTSETPPVLRFSFPIKMGSACGSNFLTTSAAGTGLFSDFSNVQSVNVSGVVQSFDATIGTVTYNTELKYYYSCTYPMEYQINNTNVDVSGPSVALTDSSGSFISTLSMTLFLDENYTTPMVMPRLGVELKTKIFVEVVTNPTSNFHVYLDRCYASTSHRPTNSAVFNLFVPCSNDELTTMLENGNSGRARFHFPAFRFTEQQNLSVSTYFLHCISRLCEVSTCSTLKQCNRKRRGVETTTIQEGITEPSLLTVPIRTKADTPLTTKDEALSSGQYNSRDAPVGLIIAVAVLIVLGLAAVIIAASFYRQLKRPS